MRLAILGGCKTAVRSPIYGSFLDHGKRLGVDSVIGFRKDIHFAPYRRFTSGKSLLGAFRRTCESRRLGLGGDAARPR